MKSIFVESEMCAVFLLFLYSRIKRRENDKTPDFYVDKERIERFPVFEENAGFDL